MNQLFNLEFIGSFASYKDCPKAMIPEFAFIGRSNVGKSSLINMLAGNEKLAKVSNTPGKTQTINFFNYENIWNLVDLPGYGYARVSKKLRSGWSKMITDYLENRQQLFLLFVLIDSRLEAQKIDLEFLNWCGDKQIPFALIFTKADKLSKGGLQSNIDNWQQSFLQSWESIPPVFVTSASTKFGRDELLIFINQVTEKNAGI